MNDVGIRVAFVTSERLYDDQRDAIQRVFGCAVANGYGGRDAGFIAHACPQGSLHITAEDIIVEAIDADGRTVSDGEEGELVITHLATRDFPFIRYRTGDVGVLSKTTCKCGRGLPVLADIRGRSTDFVVAQDGTVMHGLALIYIIRDLKGVESFKIIQESLDRTRILIVRGDGFRQELVSAIQANVKRRLGEHVDVTVELVDSIPTEASGKFRYVMSRVAPEYATRSA